MLVRIAPLPRLIVAPGLSVPIGATTILTRGDPGKPWRNGTDESFNGKLRDECLSVEWFRSRREAKVIIETWRQHYNLVRPHSSLDYRTPVEFRRHHDSITAGGRPQVANGPKLSGQLTGTAVDSEVQAVQEVQGGYYRLNDVSTILPIVPPTKAPIGPKAEPATPPMVSPAVVDGSVRYWAAAVAAFSINIDWLIVSPCRGGSQNVWLLEKMIFA